MSHDRHHAEIAAATAQGPEQFFILACAGGEDLAVGQDDLCFQEIVERKATAGDQRAVAAATP